MASVDQAVIAMVPAGWMQELDDLTLFFLYVRKGSVSRVRVETDFDQQCFSMAWIIGSVMTILLA
jgi:hypothetical protein